MTDQLHDQPTDSTTPDSETKKSVNRRRMFIAGAGLAGAAALTKAGTASAADGDAVRLGEEGAANEASTTTEVYNTGTSTDRTNNAVKGTIANAGNNSHAVLGVTAGEGHAIAGVVNNTTVNAVAATWGRQFGPAAATEGQSMTENQPIAGPANGIKGIVESPTNGSHAVLGVTKGGGHAVAGDTPADAAGAGGAGGNTVAATWGRHAGQGAGIGGINVAAASPLAGPARGVEGVVNSPANGSHAVFGATKGAGHSIAGDTPADAKGVDGVGPNTTAATWGRHGGVGAGIGGVSAMDYGGEFVGGKAQVRLIQTQDAANDGPPAGDGHLLGELYADGAGNLWFNRADGSNFTRLNNQGGIVMMTNPQRAYDSRPGEGPNTDVRARMRSGETRKIDLTTGTEFAPGYAGAIVNITVAGSSGAGHLTVFNGDTDDAGRPLASTINWYEPGTNIANGVIVPVGADGSIKVYAYATTSDAAHVVVDVVGAVS
jgi:hypothetical protein